MLALTSTTGRLGGSVLSAIEAYSLLPLNELVICTSSSPSLSRWDSLKAKGAQVRQSNFSSPSTMVTAFAGCHKLLLVSSPAISMDYNDAPSGSGREAHHIAAIDAAVEAGVWHIYYTSLAFGSPSKAGVMRAHIRTEEYLAALEDVDVMVIRQGLYSESWPLYLGQYDLKGDAKGEVLLAGDGKVAWTSVRDLGIGTALILVDGSETWVGWTGYLSSRLEGKSLRDVAALVGRCRGKEVSVRVVSREEYVKYYVQERGLDKGHVEWWAGTYEALKDGECDIKDDTLKKLLESKGKNFDPVEETIEKMLQ